SGTPIVVSGAASAGGKDIALAAGGSISGTVTIAGTTTPIAAVTVNVNYATGQFAGSATTDDLGRYTVTGLTTGQYTAQTSNALGYVNVLFNNIPCSSCSSTTGNKIDVSVGSNTPNVNFALTAGGRVTGRVTIETSGAGVADVTISLFSGTSLAG